MYTDYAYISLGDIMNIVALLLLIKVQNMYISFYIMLMLSYMR